MRLMRWLIVLCLLAAGCASDRPTPVSTAPVAAVPSCDQDGNLQRYEPMLGIVQVVRWQNIYDVSAERIIANSARYREVEARTGVSRLFIAAAHFMESGSLSFEHNLFNGEPLNVVTSKYPAGRGPWASWEDAASEAMREFADRGLSSSLREPSMPQLACLLERYNGAGYISLGQSSPYLWSGTNHYTKGKFVERRRFILFGPFDSYFDPELVSEQAGAVPLVVKLKAAGFDANSVAQRGGMAGSVRGAEP
jgi:lysozyme family protein